MYIAEIMIKIIAIAIVLTTAGFVKAFTSSRLGDVSRETKDRITLNPAKHIEPFGFLMFIITGLGWYKPIDTQSLYYKNRKKGVLITSLYPSLVCFIIGIVLFFIMKHFWILDNVYVFIFVRNLATFYMGFSLFNIIPIYPMDGSKILNQYVSPSTRLMLTNNEKIIQMILMLLMITNYLSIFIYNIVGVIVGFL